MSPILAKTGGFRGEQIYLCKRNEQLIIIIIINISNATMRAVLNCSQFQN